MFFYLKRHLQVHLFIWLEFVLSLCTHHIHWHKLYITIVEQFIGLKLLLSLFYSFFSLLSRGYIISARDNQGSLKFSLGELHFLRKSSRKLFSSLALFKFEFLNVGEIYSFFSLKYHIAITMLLKSATAIAVSSSMHWLALSLRRHP